MAANAPSKSTWKRWGITTLVLLLSTAVVVFGLVWTHGVITGEELSRDSLRRRKFRYLEIPWIHLQITGADRSPVTDVLVAELLSAGLIPSVQERADRWDLVQGARGSVQTEGAARILVAYLEAQGSEKSLYWQEWTKRHPDRAKVFWPEVAALVGDQLYPLLPDLFDAAETAASGDELKRELAARLAAGYFRFGLAQQRVGKHEDAIALFSTALTHQGDVAEILESRANSYEKIGQMERATADRDAARTKAAP